MKFVGKHRTNTLLTKTLLLLPTAFAQVYSPSANKDYAIHSNMASMLQTPPFTQRIVLSQALRIIHSMESAPICNRLAALDLINNCKSLEQSSDTVNPESEVILDEVKSEYAARLAVCELLGAKAHVPRECDILVPSVQACGKGRSSSFFSRQKKDSVEEKYCYPGTTYAQLERCLRALESRSQSWTSYSNARQNAVVMCHASRDAIDRAHSLAVYKSLTEVVANMTLTLFNTMEDIKTWVAEQQSFAEKVRATQKNALQDMHTTNEIAKSSLQSFTEALPRTVANAMHIFDASIGETVEKMQVHFKELREASDHYSAAHRNQIKSNHEAALASLQLNHETAVYSLNTLESISSAIAKDMALNISAVSEVISEAVIEAIVSKNNAITGSRPSIADLKFWATFTFFIVSLWNVHRQIAYYVMTASSFSGLLYTLNIQEWWEKLTNHAPQSLSIMIQYSTNFLASQSLGLCLLPGVAILCLLRVAMWPRVRSAHVHTLQDDQGRKSILPSIEYPGPLAN